MTYTVEYTEAVLGLLHQAGVVYTVSHGRHKMVEFIGKNGRRYKRQLSITSGDYRAAKNARAQMRRTLREAGYLS